MSHSFDDTSEKKEYIQVKIARDYTDAIRVALNISNKSKPQFSRYQGKELDFMTHEYPEKEVTSFSKIINTPHVSSNLDLSPKYVEELMEYLGNINWQESGFAVEKKIDPSNPLNLILDGIALIKGDLDDLFHEHARTVEKLRNVQEDLEKRVHECTVELIKTNSRIFDPFFTTKFQGRGLGMAPIYGIIKNHNGLISIDSRLNLGTEVKIYLLVS